MFLAPYTQAFCFNSSSFVAGVQGSLRRVDVRHYRSTPKRHSAGSAAPNCVLPETTQTRKEVILMEYRRPEIIAAVEATLAIEGMKPGGFVDNNHPTLPPKSTGAYLSDE